MSDIDRLNDLLTAAETRVVQLDWGVAAEVALKDGVALAFKRHNGEWGLYVAFAGGHVVPITSAAKEYRYLASAKLGDLVAALRIALQRDLDMASEACAQVTHFLADDADVARKDQSR